jgi:hypothetical protein
MIPIQSKKELRERYIEQYSWQGVTTENSRKRLDKMKIL